MMRWALPLLCLSPLACTDGVTPELSNLRYDGQAPDSPLVLLLSADFIDYDGDLGDGALETFIDGRETSAGPLRLLPIFLQNGLKPNATAGRLDFVLQLTFREEPRSGATFDLGAQVTDGEGRRSEAREITLKLE